MELLESFRSLGFPETDNEINRNTLEELQGILSVIAEVDGLVDMSLG